MRVSFLFLLLTNILFMAWTVWIAPASGSLGTPAPASDPTSRSARANQPPARPPSPRKSNRKPSQNAQRTLCNRRP